jgi:hypothetical protein
MIARSPYSAAARCPFHAAPIILPAHWAGTRVWALGLAHPQCADAAPEREAKIAALPYNQPAWRGRTTAATQWSGGRPGRDTTWKTSAICQPKPGGPWRTARRDCGWPGRQLPRSASWRRRVAIHQRLDPAPFPADDKARCAADPVPITGIDADPRRMAQIVTRAEQSGAIPVAPLVLQIDDVVAHGTRPPDRPEAQEGNARLLSDTRSGRRGRRRDRQGKRGRRGGGTVSISLQLHHFM